MNDFKPYKGQFDLPVTEIASGSMAIYVSGTACGQPIAVQQGNNLSANAWSVAFLNGSKGKHWFHTAEKKILCIEPSAEIKAEGYDHYLKNIE